jgi:hypothetical protein
MDNPTRSGGGTQEDSLFLGLKPQCMNPGQKGSKEEMVEYKVLHHWRVISMVHEGLSR